MFSKFYLKRIYWGLQQYQLGPPIRLVGASNKWNGNLCDRMVFALLELCVRSDGAPSPHGRNFGSARTSGVHSRSSTSGWMGGVCGDGWCPCGQSFVFCRRAGVCTDSWYLRSELSVRADS
jgi:hypothetical protein